MSWRAEEYLWGLGFGIPLGFVVGCIVAVLFFDPGAPNDAARPDRLRQCELAGGVQMVLLDDEWRCVTAEQAG